MNVYMNINMNIYMNINMNIDKNIVNQYGKKMNFEFETNDFVIYRKIVWTFKWCL